MKHDNKDKERILRDAECKARTGLSAPTRWRLEQEGEFPKRIRLTDGGSVGWLESEIDEWIRQRVSAPRTGGKRPVKHSTGRPRKADRQPEPQPAAE